MWTQGQNTTGTKYTVCGSFTEENLDTIEVVSTKATATATDLAGRTAADTETGIDLDTSIDVWYTYDADGRREYKYEEGSYDVGDPYTRYYWNDAGLLEQVDIDYGTGETPRYARGWLTWSPTGELAKLEIRVGSTLESLTEGSGGTLVLLNKYGYFGGSVIVEREEVGDPSEKQYVSMGGTYLYQADSDDAYWHYHHDGDGSVAAITDASKNIVALYEYDAFGNKLTNAGTVENHFGFYGGTLIERFGLVYEGGSSFREPETDRRVSEARLPLASASLVVTLALGAGLLSKKVTVKTQRKVRKGTRFLIVFCLVFMLVANLSCGMQKSGKRVENCICEGGEWQLVGGGDAGGAAYFYYYFWAEDLVFECRSKPELHLTANMRGHGLSSYVGVCASPTGTGEAFGIENGNTFNGRWVMAEIGLGAGCYIAGIGAYGTVLHRGTSGEEIRFIGGMAGVGKTAKQKGPVGLQTGGAIGVAYLAVEKCECVY